MSNESLVRYEKLLQLTGVLVLCLIWAIAVPKGNPFIPTLRDVAGELWQLSADGTLQRDVVASLRRIIPGVTMAFVAATLLAVIAASIRAVGALFCGVVELLRPIPPIAWVPIAIVIFGIGDAPAIAIVFLGAFFPIWLGMVQGFNEIYDQHIAAARSFGASRTILLFDIVIPSVTPYALHGLRLGLGLGWFCVVAAEMMGAHSGLGYGVQLFSLNLELERTYLYIMTIGVLGAAMNYLMQLFESRVCHWHRQIRVNGE